LINESNYNESNCLQHVATLQEFTGTNKSKLAALKFG
jgi:hypothetical protein